MRKSILAQLFNGELYPAETALPNEAEYVAAIGERAKYRDKLYASFTPAQQAFYEKMAEYHYIANDHERTVIFEEGFKLGARIALEALKDTVTPIDGISVLLKTK